MTLYGLAFIFAVTVCACAVVGAHGYKWGYQKGLAAGRKQGYEEGRLAGSDWWRKADAEVEGTRLKMSEET